MKNYQIKDIKDSLVNAKNALIVVPQISVDSVGAALAMALSFRKKGMEVTVYSPQKVDNNYSKLSGLELLAADINLSDLVVSLTYPLDQIDNVSYNDDGGHLNLVVKTKNGAPKIEDQNITISNKSTPADICFMLGDESSLGPNSTITSKGNWIFISPVNVTKSWAKNSIIDPDAPFSEIFTFLLPALGFELDPDSGKDLLIGLRVATQSFSVNVSPETFEAGSICLQATQKKPVGNQFDGQTPVEAVESKPNFSGFSKPFSAPMS